MYRVTADDWDTWSDLLTHFDVARSAIQSLVLFKYQPIQAASSVIRHSGIFFAKELQFDVQYTELR